MAKVKSNQIVLDYGELAQAEALFASIGEGAIVTDSQARISRINKAALDIMGFSEKDVIGKWFPDVFVAEDLSGNLLSNLERPIGKVFLSGKAISARAVYRRKDGSKVPVSMTVSPVFVENIPVGAIEVFRDITHEVALEQAKDEFVAITSHQLRTPATAVKQYIGLLLEGYAEPLSENQRMFLERAYESNERQLHIVEEILRITQLDLEKVILKPAKYDIRKIAREAINTVHGRFERKNQTIIVSEPDEPVMASVDKDQLRVAIENLLENASNYTWEDRSITVTTSSRNNRVYVSVKDPGVGIDPADFPKLFQKFSRVPNPLSVEIGGSGLGLYWAKQIIRMHGGTITVRSKLGKGTIFTIGLPSNI